MPTPRMLGRSSRAGVSTGDARHPLPKNHRTSPVLAQVFPFWLVRSTSWSCQRAADGRTGRVSTGHGRHRRSSAQEVVSTSLLHRPDTRRASHHRGLADPAGTHNFRHLQEDLEKWIFCVPLPPNEVRSKFTFRVTKRSVTGSRSANLKLALTPWPLASSQPKTGAGEAVKIRRDPRLRRPTDFGLNRKTSMR